MSGETDKIPQEEGTKRQEDVASGNPATSESPRSLELVSFADFMARETHLHIAFLLWWEKNQQLEPDKYPRDMGLADWGEQLTLFEENIFNG